VPSGQVGVQTIGELIMERAHVASRPSGRFQHHHLITIES